MYIFGNFGVYSIKITNMQTGRTERVEEYECIISYGKQSQYFKKELTAVMLVEGWMRMKRFDQQNGANQ